MQVVAYRIVKCLIKYWLNFGTGASQPQPPSQNQTIVLAYPNPIY